MACHKRRSMKEMVVIGDVHGLTSWEIAVENHPDSKFVFLGDYNDPYGHEISDKEVLENFRRLIDFKLSHLEDVTLLLGNHDMHYVDIELAPLCSRFNLDLSFELMMLFDEYGHYFQNAYEEEKLLFTHAGVSEEWFANFFQATTKKEIAWQLNNCSGWQKEALHHCGVHRGGKSPNGGIFWADKNELGHPLEGYIQIVGHNRVDNVEECIGENGAKILFCDCLHKGNYLTIDLSKKEEPLFKVESI